MDEEQKQEKRIEFDPSKITADELLDVMEIAGKENAAFTRGDLAKLAHTMRKALIQGANPLSGADMPQIMQQFMMFVLGGGSDSKNSN